MRSGYDDEAFDAVLRDLCLAFNRPYTPDLTRVYWESLKHLNLLDVKRAADSARRNLKKFPTPKDLSPEKRASAPRAKEQLPELSAWAIGANKILLRLMMSSGKGMVPDHLPPILAAKADYVRMAEHAEADGARWDDREFIDFVTDGLERLVIAAPFPDHVLPKPPPPTRIQA